MCNVILSRRLVIVGISRFPKASHGIRFDVVEKMKLKLRDIGRLRCATKLEMRFQ